MKMHYFIFFVGSGPGTCSTQRGPPHIAVQVEMEIPNPNLCRIPTPSTMEWCSLCEDYFMGLKKGTVTADVRTKRPNPSLDVFRLSPRVQRPVQVYHRPWMLINEGDAETYIKRTLILSMIGGNHEGQQGRLSVDLSLRSIHFWFDT
jgi:hypothetical protein